MRRSLRAVVLALALAVSAALLPASPAEAASKRSVGRPSGHFWGTHVLPIGEGIFPESRAIGSVRLWDTWTAWRHVNPEPGVFVWDTLDRAVDTARARGASVTLVLGQTPAWAAPGSPGHPSWKDTVIGSGAGSFPADHARWVEYVAAVAKRYKGRVSAYETWNEVNLSMYAGLTPAQMVRLQSLAYRTVKRIDPAAVVTAPSVTVRGGTGPRFLYAFAKAGGFRYADAVSLHAYPEPNSGPEAAVAMIGVVRDRLARLGVRKPIWDTEVNYGLPWGGNGLTAPLTPTEQAAYVARTYLLHHSVGVKRVYWYAYMEAPFLGVAFRDGNPAALAFERTRSWLGGHRMDRCTRGGAGVYSCRIYRGRMLAVVKWHPSRVLTVDAPRRARRTESLFGVVERVRVDEPVTVSPSPVVIWKRRR